MGMHRKAVDLLGLMRGSKSQPGQPAKPVPGGLKIVKIETTDPDPITFTFEGRKTAVDLDVLDVPVSFYPLRKGDRLLVLPMATGARYGAVTKLDDGLVLADVLGSSSLKPDGMDAVYEGADLIFPQDVTFAAGDRAAIFPTLVAGQIKYAVIKM